MSTGTNGLLRERLTRCGEQERKVRGIFLPPRTPILALLTLDIGFSIFLNSFQHHLRPGPFSQRG